MDPFKKKTESQLLDEIFVKDTIKETLNKPKKTGMVEEGQETGTTEPCAELT